jgi:hypothetical protein
MRRPALIPRPGTLLPALLLAAAACSGTGDIQPGVGAAGVRIGDDRAAVEKSLGAPEQSTGSGVAGSQQKRAVYLLYPSRGIDVLLEEGKVRSIFLYREGADDHRNYPGRTPEGITLSSRRDDVLRAFGDPSARGLGDDADRWFRYDSGIEFNFQPDGSLHHIIVTRPR